MREQRSRQACEACRRKKSKCTGERPICSFCRRLGQSCVYRSEPVPETNRVTKNSKAGSASLKNRFQALESQVKDMYKLIQQSSSDLGQGALQHQNASTNGSGNQMQPQITTTNHELHISDRRSNPSAANCFSSTSPNPPAPILDHFIQVYRKRVHYQPLPIFRLDGLKTLLTSSPKILLWSFLALMLSFSSHGFYQGKETEAIEFYGRSAEETVRSQACTGASDLEVVQSLCLLALKDIMACKPDQAWITIGTASRLEAMRSLSRNDSPNGFYDQDMNSRCHWSVFILEKTFSPHHMISEDSNEMEFPTSAPLPPPLANIGNDDCPPDLYNNSEDMVGDLGICEYYIKMISIWGSLSSYLHQVRLGKAELAWIPGSEHSRLIAKVYEHESHLPHKHLVRNVYFSKRSAEELFEQREYWAPWMIMQVISHSAPAILNHPFIHVVAMRDGSTSPQSRFFLQQIVDLAIFHSGWVFRLLRTCEELQFEITDPLIGHIVAATATIPWLFQFASDPKVAETAKEDLAWCKTFLRHMSLTWPHISQKLEILQNLQTIADDHPSNAGERGVSITFQPSLFWALLDPKICQMTPPSPVDGGASHLSGIPDARIRITTHYVHPLGERGTSHQSREADSNLTDAFLLSPEQLEQVYLDDIFSHFIPNDIDGL